jgi:hypothetical protein
MRSLAMMPSPRKQAVLQFLNGDQMQRWAQAILGR